MPELPRDEPGLVREEDAFDVARVHAWLRAQRPDVPDETPEVRQYPGGSSNLTYLLRYRRGNEDYHLILRRPPRGRKAASAHDMAREHRVQAALKPVFPYVPEMIGFCDDPNVLGSDFYVMERVRGFIVRDRLPEGLELSPSETGALADRLFDTLIALHQVNPAQAGLESLGRGPGYVRRQVEGWSTRFRAARTDNVPDFEAVMTWLHETQPDDVGACVIHNDFRLDNVVLGDDLRVIAVLDWEMSTIGDPLMDLGGALAYWVEADDDDMFQYVKRQPSDLAGMPTRAEIVERYAGATGLAADDWTFYEVFGLFRLAVIVQQIYFRFHHGETTNPRFKDFWLFAGYLEARCRRIAGLL